MVDYAQLCGVKDLEEGKGKLFEVNGRRVAIFKVDGKIYAIDDYCTHAEASLAEGFLDGTVVECPWHGAKFDLKTGEALCMPATSPVHIFDVKVENDFLYISPTPKGGEK